VETQATVRDCGTPAERRELRDAPASASKILPGGLRNAGGDDVMAPSARGNRRLERVGEEERFDQLPASGWGW
jgi:hypothetical protein